MTRPIGPFNIPFRIFILTVALAFVGVVMVYSSSANYASRQDRRTIARIYGQEALADSHEYHNPRLGAKQLCWVAIGICAMLLAYKLDYNLLREAGPYLLLLCLGLLLLVFVPGVRSYVHAMGQPHYRWIKIGPMTFQPSEFAKLAMIIYMARMLNNHHDKMRSLVHGVLPALGLTAVVAGLIVAEPDIGATAVLTSIVFLMWFIGGMKILHLLGLVAATIPAFILVVLQYPDRVERLLAFAHPTEESLLGKGMQLNQSLIAVGSGGMSGLGLGNSMQKHFLTEQYSDFIFAIIAEELGFIGAAIIILCFFLLIWEGWRVALRAPDFYASLLASGVTLMLAINVCLNLMVVLGLAPTKGLALPLLSYGGSNMVITMTSMGILMNIGWFIERERARTAGRSPTAREKKRPARTKAKPKRRFRRAEV